MDRTLNPFKRRNKRRRERNWRAWLLFSPDPENHTCRFCPHGPEDHLTSSSQPHFYRPATEDEQSSLTEKLYVHKLPCGSNTLVKRVAVSQKAELITAYCTKCAEEKKTAQVLCYQRTLGTGEIIGLKNDPAGVAR